MEGPHLDAPMHSRASQWLYWMLHLPARSPQDAPPFWELRSRCKEPPCPGIRMSAGSLVLSPCARQLCVCVCVARWCHQICFLSAEQSMQRFSTHSDLAPTNTALVPGSSQSQSGNGGGGESRAGFLESSPGWLPLSNPRRGGGEGGRNKDGPKKPGLCFLPGAFWLEPNTSSQSWPQDGRLMRFLRVETYNYLQ